MESSDHINWNSIIYRKGVMYWNETERPFLSVKGFNTPLVHFLPKYYVIISNMHVCSFACTIFHVHGRAPKMVLCARNLAYEKL